MTTGLPELDDTSVRTWGTGLVQLVNRHLPKPVKRGDGHAIEDWPLAGTAYLTKATGTLESMFFLFGQEEKRAHDATVLLRSLYENILVFSWVGIDPAAHLPRWIKSVCDMGIKADDDWKTISVSLLDARNREYAEKKINDKSVKFAPKNPQMAQAIDDHWHRTYPGHPTMTGTDEDLLTFRGLYRHVYRLGSQAVHQDPRSLNAFFTTDATGFTSAHTEKPGRYYLYPWLFGDHVVTLGLAIASSVLGWPHADEVWAIREAAFSSVGTLRSRSITGDDGRGLTR